MSSSASTALYFTLSGGNKHDAPEGRLLLETVGIAKDIVLLLMDKAPLWTEHI